MIEKIARIVSNPWAVIACVTILFFFFVSANLELFKLALDGSFNLSMIKRIMRGFLGPF